MNDTFIDTLRNKFYQKLEAKTGWGRNEIKDKFNEAIADTAFELLKDIDKK